MPITERRTTNDDQIRHRWLARDYRRRFHLRKCSPGCRSDSVLCFEARRSVSRPDRGLRHAFRIANNLRELPPKFWLAAGIPIKLASDYSPTPAISFAVKNTGAAGGVVITSSHNPWNWNGVKFKAKFGGSATPAIMKVIEQEVAAGASPKGTQANIEEVDLKPAYIRAICQFADLDLIAKARFKFAVDSMYGSGRGILAQIFQRTWN